MNYLMYVLTAVIAYLLGSISVGMIASKLMGGPNLREVGSGNTGATNALRALGKKGGAIVFVGDILKALIASIIGSLLCGFEGKLIAAMELCPESWSNRLRMTELWVHPDFQKQGLGGKLMDFAKDYVRKKKYRTLMLETQSCNVNAVDFYLHKGLTLIGFDACCYNNKDLERKEVRLEMGWFPEETA